jgi:hypothetical protein
MTYGLWYPRNQSLQLTAYSDADWANCIDERKRTSGGAFFLGNSLVVWLSKKQGSISLSTTVAEYIVAATCCTQVLWMIQTLADLEVKILHRSQFIVITQVPLVCLKILSSTPRQNIFP